MENKNLNGINFRIFSDDNLKSPDEILKDLESKKLNLNLIRGIGHHIFHYPNYSNLRKCIMKILDGYDDFTKDDMLALFIKSAQGRFIKDLTDGKYSFEEFVKSEKFSPSSNNYKIFTMIEKDPDEYLIGFSTMDHFLAFFGIILNDPDLSIENLSEKKNIILELVPELKNRKEVFEISRLLDLLKV